MKDFYQENSRVKLMLFKDSSQGTMPTLGKLKKEFSAKEVKRYKCDGTYWSLILNLVTYHYKAAGEELSRDDWWDINYGYYYYFDASAALSLTSVLRYSGRAYKYFDVSYADYCKARDIVSVMEEIRRSRSTIEHFRLSLKSLQETFITNGISDDVGNLKVEDLKAQFATIGARGDEALRARLALQCEKFVWQVAAPIYSGANQDSANDEDDFREAA